MAKRIFVLDTTLRDGEQAPGCSMNIHEKLQVAQKLQKLGVDVIEAGFPAASQGDFESVKQIAESIDGCVVAGLARAIPHDIDRTWDAIKSAKHPRIHTFLATSPIHMEYKLQKTADEVYEQAVKMVKYAKKYCDDVQFSAEDATRSELVFLYRIIEGVIEAGATVINIPDTVGYTTPNEFKELIEGIKKNVCGIDKVKISVHCHDDLGMAAANTLAAIQAGADQIECTVNGIGERAGNAALEEVVMNLITRRDIYNAFCGIKTTEISNASKVVSTATGVKVPPNKAIVGANAFAHESGIHQHGVMANKSTYEIMTPESIGLDGNTMVLGKHSGKHAFEERLEELGYKLPNEEVEKAFKKFKDLADRIKEVTDQDIQEIIASEFPESDEKYFLVRFNAIIGSDIPCESTVTLQKADNGELTATRIGNGSIDASFKAINSLVEAEFELRDYIIHGIKPGQDAQGSVVLEISKPGSGKIYKGRGISTDIVEASIKAYLDAINQELCE